jgi:hypothetical protein
MPQVLLTKSKKTILNVIDDPRRVEMNFPCTFARIRSCVVGMPRGTIVERINTKIKSILIFHKSGDAVEMRDVIGGGWLRHKQTHTWIRVIVMNSDISIVDIDCYVEMNQFGEGSDSK